MPTARQTLDLARGTLAQLTQGAERLVRLTAAVRAVLPRDIAPRVTVARCTHTSVTFVADDAAVATTLRFAIPDILRRLESLPDFATIEHTRVRVARSPGDLADHTALPPPHITSQGAAHLKAAADALPDLSAESSSRNARALAGLRSALRSLAETATSAASEGSEPTTKD